MTPSRYEVEILSRAAVVDDYTSLDRRYRVTLLTLRLNPSATSDYIATAPIALNDADYEDDPTLAERIADRAEKRQAWYEAIARLVREIDPTLDARKIDPIVETVGEFFAMTIIREIAESEASA